MSDQTDQMAAEAAITIANLMCAKQGELGQIKSIIKASIEKAAEGYQNDMEAKDAALRLWLKLLTTNEPNNYTRTRLIGIVKQALGESRESRATHAQRLTPATERKE